MVEGTQVELAQEISPAQRHIIERPRLYKLLDEANARIILLVAPAGYGKTTLARQWTARRGRRALWYRVGLAARDPSAFAEELANAVSADHPQAPKRVREYLLGASSPDREPVVLAEVVAEEISPWSDDAWLVVDDYQTVIGAGVSDTFFERLVALARPNIVITSREHPKWISARRVLYGEVFEVGRDELAMNDEEATAVLSFGGLDSDELVKLAEGWPAVLGLAAHLPRRSALKSKPPDSLHAYFAQELYDLIDSSVRHEVPLLSLGFMLDPLDLQYLFGDAARAVREEATRVGLAAPVADGRLEIHPLVRAFLEEKLAERPPSPRLVERFVQHLLQRAHWENAFALIERFELIDSVPQFFALALRDVLRTGRVASLESWVRWTDKQGVNSPEVLLARAEILVRRGEWVAAQTLALAAAKQSDTPLLAAQAYLRAGGAGHLADDLDAARSHFAAAHSLTSDKEIVAASIWGRVLVAVLGGDRNEFRAARHALEAIPEPEPPHLVRIAQARILEAGFSGNLANAADAALGAEALLESVPDPFVRTGFLNILADALMSSARYDAAERVARAELRDAQRNRLAFVYPNALLNLAAARLGRLDFAGCEAYINEVEDLGGPSDPFIDVNLIGVRARLEISRGRETSAAVAEIPPLARGDIRSEAVASLALAAAIRGDGPMANELIDLSREWKGFVLGLTEVLRAAAIAVVAVSEATEFVGADDALASLNSVAMDRGVFDGLICATRGYPPLLEALIACGYTESLATAARRSGDSGLRSALGLPRPSTRRRELSAREIEVLSLVAQGLRNAEISRRLFISPKTVKTHLQNIFDKVDARSRTEAVVKAKDRGLLD